jgi:hypothetical protein
MTSMPPIQLARHDASPASSHLLDDVLRGHSWSPWKSLARVRSDHMRLKGRVDS